MPDATLQFRAEDWDDIQYQMPLSTELYVPTIVGNAGEVGLYEMDGFGYAADILVQNLPDVPWMVWTSRSSEDGEVVYFYLPDGSQTYYCEAAVEGELYLPASALDDPAAMVSARQVLNDFKAVRDLLHDGPSS